MQEAKQEANQVTFNSLINACARASDEQRSWVAFRDMKASGLVPDTYTLAALLKSQSSDSGIFKALDIVLRIDPSRLNRFVFSAGFSALKRYAKNAIRQTCFFSLSSCLFPNCVFFLLSISQSVNYSFPLFGCLSLH